MAEKSDLILSLSKDAGRLSNAETALAGLERAMEIVGFVYMLRCRDGSYDIGSARGGWNALERRVHEHNAGTFDDYTKSRPPIELVFHQEFQRIADAIVAERQIKGWSRAKKEALIRGEWELVSQLARNYTQHPRRHERHTRTKE